MSTQARPPVPIFGFLKAGDSTTRRYSCQLPEGYMAMVQNFPHGDIRLVEQSKDCITVQNSGDRASPYGIYFVTQTHIKTFMAAKQLVDIMRGKR